MNIAALTYSFGTLKTEAGMHHLALHGFTPKLMVAAPWIKLDFYKSKIRVVPRDIPVPEPSQLARHYGAAYHEVPHNSEEACSLMQNHEIDVAVILGARILKQPIIDSTTLGILNLHPGILPQNRGLDTVKWAVLLDFPQGATAHMIDTSIDMGVGVAVEEVPVFLDDSLMDLQLRVQATERVVMIRALQELAAGRSGLDQQYEAGEYRHSVPPEKELELEQAFWKYKLKHT